MALIGTAINDGAAPTYINLIFALSLMGDMPTNKARTSDNAQQQSSICSKSNSLLFCFILFFLFVLQSLFLFTCQSAFNLLYIFCWRKVLWNYTTLHKHISNSSIVGNMLLAYTTFSLKVFGLYIHARHFCRKIFCFDTDSGEEICQWSFLGDSHASLQRCSIQTKYCLVSFGTYNSKTLVIHTSFIKYARKFTLCFL